MEYEMEKLFEQFIEAALRDIEKEVFPETEDVKLAKERAKKLNVSFRMVELNISEDVCWLISETLKMHNEKQGEFSIQDAIKLRLKMEELFLTE
jgi:hypothetical protein